MEMENPNLDTVQKDTAGQKDTANPKKRTYVDAFGQREYEKERYGQEIDDEFFERNQGHGVFTQ